MNSFKVIGLMSGTSLDGLDIAFCRFVFNKGKWTYKILNAETVLYTPFWKKQLKDAELMNARSFAELNTRYGVFLGQAVKAYIKKHRIKPELISSHGHTVFHEPAKGFSVQIGSGAQIASQTKLPVVCDLRSVDVALGGQGAPLVPIGDKLLFSQYDYCVNIGGIANVSMDIKGKRVAYDICVANMALNSLAERLGKAYDRGGMLAAKGNIISNLLDELNQLPYYKKRAPKSLGKEWFLSYVEPLFTKYKRHSVNDLLRTVTEHCAIQIAMVLGSASVRKNALITGGGAYNNFLIDRVRAHTSVTLILPDDVTIQFKEALIFAFLGTLRINSRKNSLRDVTGAKMDSSGGAIYIV